MIDWSDLKFVLETVRQGGLSGAARVLNVNHATVSRRISSAEDSIGALLFDRLPGGYKPTAAGLDAARTAETMEQASAELNLSIGSRDLALKGPLTITAPQLLVERILGPILASFCKLHPEIELTILATNEALNLSHREADVAIRISNSPTDTLHGSCVAEQRAAVYVSREYAKHLKDGPTQCLDWIRFSHWPGIPDEIGIIWPNRRITLSVDDMMAAIGAVRAGIGATRMACFLGETDPKLIRLPGLSTFDYAGVWVLTHPDLRRVKRIETFMRFVSTHMRQLRSTFIGTSTP